MLKEIRNTNSGLIIAQNQKGFIQAFSKKVTKQVHNLYSRNVRMLDLVRAAGNLPLTSHPGYPVDVISNPFRPPQWRETSIKLRAAYYQKALTQLDARHTININLSANLLRRSSGKNTLDYIRRAISRELKRKLKRDVDFWLAIETGTTDSSDKKFYDVYRNRLGRKACKRDIPVSTREGRPHLHGVIAINDDEVKLIKEAIRVVNGKESAAFVCNELRINSLDDGIGWVTYATKKTGVTRTFLPNSKVITCTNKVSQLAKRIYNNDRQSIIKVIK